MTRSDDSPEGSIENATHDLIVIGAGCGGMATALFAAAEGLDVLLVESTEYVGGTTAYSAGSVWVPNTHLAGAVADDDSAQRAAAYLDDVVADHADRRLREAFLAAGPAAIRALEQHGSVRLQPYPLHPDYESDAEGSTVRGRALQPVAFDGRRLGSRFALVRPPIPEFTVLGGMMVDRTDIGHLLGMGRSFASFRHAMRILARHLRDRLGYPRGTRLVMGNALVAGLLHSLDALRVPVWTQAVVRSLDRDDDARPTRITGVTVVRAERLYRLQARAGVVLATGGFNRHPQLRTRLLPNLPTRCPGAPGHTGEALVLALAAGARIGDRGEDNAFWTPVSVRRRKDGSMAVFPHFVLDRAKPGTVVVDQSGERFVNESTSYHRFGQAMLARHREQPCIPALLIADDRALRAYGLGMVRPGGRGLKPFLDDGYLVRAATLRELAGRLQIDPARLERTVAAMNDYARTGEDLQFRRGRTAYERNLGDAAVGPNPTLGPIDRPPFYAVRLFPGDIGASAGLVTDADARVLAAGDSPIPGLFAVGNDMNSIMGGTYPGPGITLGPAITFGYLAARAAAAELASADPGRAAAS